MKLATILVVQRFSGCSGCFQQVTMYHQLLMGYTLFQKICFKLVINPPSLSCSFIDFSYYHLILNSLYYILKRNCPEKSPMRYCNIPSGQLIFGWIMDKFARTIFFQIYYFGQKCEIKLKLAQLIIIFSQIII